MPKLSRADYELQKAKLQLTFSRDRESKRRDEMLIFLSGLAEHKRAKTPEEQFLTIIAILRRIMDFENAAIYSISRDGSLSLFTAEKQGAPVSIPDCPLVRRVLAGKSSEICRPWLVKGFEKLGQEDLAALRSSVLMDVESNGIKRVFILMSSKPLTLGFGERKRLVSYKPFIEYALSSMDYRNHMEELVRAKTAELERSRQTIYDYASISSDAFWRLGNDLKLRDLSDLPSTASNSDAMRFFAHAEGKTLESLFSVREREHPQHYNDLVDRMERHEPFRNEVFEFQNEGLRRSFSLSGMPFSGPDGGFEGYHGTATDVTGEVEYQKRMKAVVEAETKANRIKSDFLAIMSHEIKTPMQAILGMLDLLSQTETSEKQDGLIRHITDSAKVLQTLINDVLDFSRMRSDQVSFEKKPFSIRYLMDTVIVQMQEKARGRPVKFVLQVEESFPKMMVGDQARMAQIFFNLLGNALKFTPSGTITLHASWIKSHRLYFEVIDTGIGISAESLRHLFVPFRQSDSSVSRRFGGTGLGLAISKRIVELMGGNIGVTSEEGHGSRFWFIVPYHKPIEHPVGKESIVAGNGAQKRNFNILLVEDSQINRFILRTMLEKLGHKVTVAENGQEAVRLVEEVHPELVFMDLQMPLMDGFEASRLILKYHPKLVILALTANVTEEERTKCREAGMTDIVGKPVTTATLQNVIKAFTNVINESLGEEGGSVRHEGGEEENGRKKKKPVVRPLDE